MKLSGHDKRAALPTDNPDWGFDGTIRKALERLANDSPRLYEIAAERLISEAGMTPEQARDALDSTSGRHLADAVADAAQTAVYKVVRETPLQNFIRHTRRVR